MTPTALVLAGLALGQPPATLPPVVPLGEAAPSDSGGPTVGRFPVRLLGQQPPESPPTPAKPETPSAEPGPQNYSLSVPPAPAAAEAAAPAAAAAATPRYAFMRSVQGSWLGLLLDDNKITVNGWTQFSYTPSSASGTNLPTTLNDRANEFLMNQNYLHVERQLDTTARKAQLGFLTDFILPGTDYRYSLARGLLNGQLTENDGRPELYGVDIFQFYGQAFLPGVGPRGTKVVAGRFATHVGYELVQAVDTPFVSRSYLFQYNPFTHTGVWATSALTDSVTVGNGVATGSDTFIDPANRATYLGQVKWAPPTGRASVTFNTVLSDPSFDAAEAFTFFNVFDLVWTYKVSDRLGYVGNATYSYTRDVPDVGTAEWYGIANYLTYQFAPTLSGTVRAEVFRDETGFRTGFQGTYAAATLGLAWKPLPSLLVRPLVRYDYNDDSRPFEGDRDLFTAAIDLIVRW